jgi:endonuclease IV
MSAPTMRIRQILDGLKGTGRKPLLKYIPRPAPPTETKGLFPNALLAALPYDQKYSVIGLLTEQLVLTKDPITTDAIFTELAALGYTLDEPTKAKITKSKTTTDYIKKVEATRKVIAEKLVENGDADEPILLNQELSYKQIEGHPDAIAGRTVMEVKTSSKLEEDFNYFLLQLCAYVAMGDGYYTQALLVLPLQQTVVAINTRLWPKHKSYRSILNTKAKALLETRPIVTLESYMNTTSLLDAYGIGRHTKKAPSLLETVTALTPGIPFQIFMGGNQNSRLTVKEKDLIAAAEYVAENNIILYIHSPYLINLSGTAEDEWHYRYMEKLLTYGDQLGAKGVVVHTGKHTKDTYEEGVEKMRHAINTILPSATAACPLLLETPAGQGSETLQGMDEFLEFVESFESHSIRACIDTCHVFANGHDPLEYVETAHAKGLVHLVHFNDSQDCCGSCKDRHAAPGQGKIGLEKMTQIAEYCSKNRIDMLWE